MNKHTCGECGLPFLKVEYIMFCLCNFLRKVLVSIYYTAEVPLYLYLVDFERVKPIKSGLLPLTDTVTIYDYLIDLVLFKLCLASHFLAICIHV